MFSHLCSAFGNQNSSYNLKFYLYIYISVTYVLTVEFIYILTYAFSRLTLVYLVSSSECNTCGFPSSLTSFTLETPPGLVSSAISLGVLCRFAPCVRSFCLSLCPLPIAVLFCIAGGACGVAPSPILWMVGSEPYAVYRRLYSFVQFISFIYVLRNLLSLQLRRRSR